MQLENNSHLKSPAKVVKIIQLTKLNYKIMKSILKKAVLTNATSWKTIITWYSDGINTYVEEEMCYLFGDLVKSQRKRTDQFTNDQFNEAYDYFHQLLKEWI